MFKQGFNKVELITGAAIAALGVGALFEARGYRLGTFASMGPGMFPTMLGLILIALGIGVMLEGRMANTIFERIPVRPLLALSGSVIGFAVCITRFGVIPALVVLVLVAGLAEQRMDWRSTAITIVILSACAWLALTLLPYAFNLRLFVV